MGMEGVEFPVKLIPGTVFFISKHTYFNKGTTSPLEYNGNIFAGTWRKLNFKQMIEKN